MKRLLGLDYGDVRIGIALSDPLKIFSKPYTVLANNEKLFPKLKKLIKQKNIEKIIVGLPLNLSGKDSSKTKEVRQFARKLSNYIDIPLTFWDERFSSEEANSILEKMGYSYMDSKKLVDKVAAHLILKNYMENKVK